MDLFAATTQLEALGIFLSAAVTKKVGYKKRNNTHMGRHWYSQVYAEHTCMRLAGEMCMYKCRPEDHEDGICGELNMSMYGTRDAAETGGEASEDFMVVNACKQRGGSAGTFHNEQRDIRADAHGVDFTLLGDVKELDWFNETITKMLEHEKSESERDERSKECACGLQGDAIYGGCGAF